MDTISRLSEVRRAFRYSVASSRQLLQSIKQITHWLSTLLKTKDYLYNTNLIYLVDIGVGSASDSFGSVVLTYRFERGVVVWTMNRGVWLVVLPQPLLDNDSH